MPIQFYGVIEPVGRISRSYASSNNFIVNKDPDVAGVYELTLDQWIASKPLVGVSPLPGYDVTVQCSQVSFDSSSNTYSLTVLTLVDGLLQNQWFQLQVVSGNSYVAEVPSSNTLTLDADIIQFGPNEVDVLRLSTTLSNGTIVFFDERTFITGVGESLTIALGTGPAGYTLHGFTYGPGTDNPTEWDSSFDLSIEGMAPETGLNRIVVTATSGDVTISSDPIIRLSKTPPGGITPISAS